MLPHRVAAGCQEPACQHRLPRTRRTTQQQMVPARRGDRQGVRRRPAGDVARSSSSASVAPVAEAARLELTLLDVRRAQRLAERDRTVHVDARHQARLGKVRDRHDHTLEPGSCRGEHGRQYAGDPAAACHPVRLADVHGRSDRAMSSTPPAARAATAMPTSNPGPCLGRLAGDRLTVSRLRGRSSRCSYGIPHTLDRLAQRLVRLQADDPEVRGLRRDIGLDLDEMSVHAGQRDRPGARRPHRRSSRCSSAAVAGRRRSA